ncbi:MAG: hypothetical protein JW990_20010 [Thermoleophilia bacterium]|nr:hypothetical protein [Thermoleophilia bacterium]
MKPQSGAQQGRRGASEQSSAASLDSEIARFPGLVDEREKCVVDCLRSAPGGLTLRQLEVKMPGGTVDMGKVLAGLVDRKLVSSLNTLIPTYTLRDTGAGVHAD